MKKFEIFNYTSNISLSSKNEFILVIYDMDPNLYYIFNNKDAVSENMISYTIFNDNPNKNCFRFHNYNNNLIKLNIDNHSNKNKFLLEFINFNPNIYKLIFNNCDFNLYSFIFNYHNFTSDLNKDMKIEYLNMNYDSCCPEKWLEKNKSKNSDLNLKYKKMCDKK